MDTSENSEVEHAILAVLTGTPVTEAAARLRASPETLIQATEHYRTAGRAALRLPLPPCGWPQVNIEFADYPTAEQAFTAYLLPPLEHATATGTITAWWFVRKHPCWRLRVASGSNGAAAPMAQPIVEALNATVSARVVKRWWPSLYEPETTAFGGAEGMDISHALFHTDSAGALDYLHRMRTADSMSLDAKAVSLIVVSLFLRAAGQEWSEQGDVWARVEVKRPLPDDIHPERVTAMSGPLRKLLMINAVFALAAGGPLAPYTKWITGMQRGAQTLAQAGREGRLNLGTRAILARHILFHWNRMGFSTDQQAIWARAARETMLG